MSPVAQMNMGFLRYPMDDARLSPFLDNLDRVNGLADRAPGFVWRLKGDGGGGPENDAGFLFGRPDVAVATLSVWETLGDLEAFVHRTVHGQFLRRRAEWFEPLDQPAYVIWPVAPGHIPTLAEGKERLLMLREHGPGGDAFDFASRAAAGH